MKLFLTMVSVCLASCATEPSARVRVMMPPGVPDLPAFSSLSEAAVPVTFNKAN